MSVESSKVLKRQWHIIRYLLKGVYVSTTHIKEHLNTLDMDIELRIIQRDLLMLEQIFPLECRRDSMPYSWRWKRVQGVANTGISLSQALTLRLVEEQLQDVMSPKLVQELQPLFEKARIVTGIIDGKDDDTIERSSPKRGIPKHGFNLHRRSPVSSLLFGVLNRLESAISTSNVYESDDSIVFADVINFLREQDLDELVEDLQGAVRVNE
jgi:hypothetical protein